MGETSTKLEELEKKFNNDMIQVRADIDEEVRSLRNSSETINQQIKRGLDTLEGKVGTIDERCNASQALR